MKKICYATFILGLLSISSKAQFTINTELRPRGEIRNGYKSLFDENDNTAYFVSQRTRLGIMYEHEKYNIKITSQDVRVWGDESLYNSTSVKGDNASLELYEAWLQLKLGQYSSIKIGRQEWSYDDQRLLSTRNWGQSGLSYDGVVLKFDNKNFRADLGLSLNNDAENSAGNEYTPDKMKFLDFIYLNKNLGQNSIITFTGILSGYQKEEGSETIYVSATYGPYLKVKKAKFELESSFFHQSGTNKKGQNINAYLFSVNGIYKFSTKFTFGPGLDIISGNDPSSTNNKDHSFDVLYGGRHRFLGEMDLFNDLTKSTRDAGIIDLFAKANFEANSKNSINITYHHFLTQRSIPDPDNTEEYLNNSLGDELDIMYRYKSELPLDLRIGISFFNTTKNMNVLQGIDGNAAGIQYFIYVQLSFTPKLFTSKE